MTGKTFSDGIGAAVLLLSTHVPAAGGRYCSAAELRPVRGPSASQKLYIEEIEQALDAGGGFEEGIAHAIRVLSTKKVDRVEESPTGWGLVPSDEIDVWRQMFIAALQRMIDSDG